MHKLLTIIITSFITFSCSAMKPKEEIRIDFTKKLPQELVKQIIFNLVNPEDIGNLKTLTQVNKTLNNQIREICTKYHLFKIPKRTLCGELGSRAIALHLVKSGIASEKLLEKYPVNEDSNKKLLWAVQSGLLESTKAYLQENADVNCIDDSENYTPLMFAVDNKSELLVQILLDAGADVNFHPTGDYIMSDFTALMFAVMSNNKDMVMLLLKAGADITIKNAMGNTAYDIAHQFAYKDIAKLVKTKNS
ncbi:MAG: ankyrin repeat domain-containing protein [Candidatus Dependentiae bacterium]|nr:ankyrin repeat domain-containing protein [Candidatus Dependentiae bacterium]